MIIYVIIAFVAILIGMAISVSAFGTGGKRKKIFQDIYFSVEDVDGIGVLYTKTGEYSAILKMENPVQKYSANIDSYYEFNHLVTALAQTLGEGYAIHKQDVFVRKQFQDESNDNHEFLSESYFKYFNGRSYTDSQTYLIITQENKKSRIFSFDSKKWRDFMVKIRKVKDQLKDSGVEASYLDGNTAREYVDRYFSMNFNDKTVSMTNFKVDEESISMGNKRCKVYSLVDVDCVSTPSIVRPFTNIEVNNVSMPVDMVSLVDSIPSADVVVYNQMFFIPNQKRELSLLDKKKNRHASMPNPSNQIAVEDIKKVQDVIARENKQLVYAHFNLVVGVPIDADIQKCTNHLENSFGRLGIHISKRAYNQLELFVNSFPGNCYSTNQEYDRFLTLSDAAACLMYKERIQHSEETPLKIYYTDRQGVPVAIDISGKEGKNKITDNSNFFCLGPSGSGKSFHMNSVVRQMWEQITLRRFRGLPSNAWVDEVISNLEWRFGLRGKQENMIGFEQNPYLRGLNLLPDIIDAATSHQAVRITYRNYKNCDEEYTVVVHPWYIKQYNNRWFLLAYDAEADRISNYALDRIQNFNVEEDVAYIPNKEVDFEHYFDDVFGVTIPPSDVEKIRVLLQFSKKQYPYIVSKPLHHSQEIVDAENRILAVEVRPTYEFTQLILSFGFDVKVLEPEPFKQEILANLRRNLQNYNEMQIDCTD